MTFTLDTQDNWPDSLDQTEAKVLNKLLTTIIAAGYAVRVREEEGDVMQITTRSRALLQAATAQTGVTFYDVMRSLAQDQIGPPFERLGTFLLVHGNGLDIVSDRHWPASKPESEALLNELAKPAADYADEQAHQRGRFL